VCVRAFGENYLFLKITISFFDNHYYFLVSIIYVTSTKHTFFTMKIAQCMLRQWAATSSRSKGTKTTASRAVAAMGSSSSSGNSSVSFFCTGSSPDLFRPSATTMSSSNGSSSRSFSSRSTLLELLAREENEEVDTGNTEMPQDLSDLRNTIEESWKIVEGGASTELFKIDSPSGKKIQLSFHCQDFLEVDVDVDVEESGYDAEENDDEEDGDNVEEPSPPVRFTVTVSKAGKSLNFACFSEYGEVKIEGVSTTAASTAEYVHEHQGQLPKIEYQGPDFTELTEDLQETMVVYLDEECGVNSDVAAFVAMSSDFREELSYVDFLKQAQSIVS
jgi:hypothetical protein